MTNAGPRARRGPAYQSLGRRLKLGHLLFLLLLFSGIIPLLISSSMLIRGTRERLKTQEIEILTLSAEKLANTLSQDLARRKDHLRQLGQGLLAAPGFPTVKDRLLEKWVDSYLASIAGDRPEEILAFRVLDQRGEGKRYEPSLSLPAVEAMDEAFAATIASGESQYRFVILSAEQDPGVVISVPVPTVDGEETLVLEVLVRPQLTVASADASDIAVEELFLVDTDGQLLWSPGSRPEVELALLESDLVREFERLPIRVASELDLEVGGELIPTLTRILPMEETGWGVVAHKPAHEVFEEVRRMVFNTAVASILLVILALAFAAVAARLFSRPIQSLVTASHEIAAGNFNRRVKTTGLAFELANLAQDFNRMGEYVENYIDQLRRAAEANRELFISTIRAFAATIDAKDPYTRGHSSRVAQYSRAIAQYLGMPKDMQERVWIAAVLHDVGKIGVDDRILKKGGVLTPEEFEQMKLHPVIGAEIVEPILQLHEMIPGIRGHHEAWNGSGYPDGLRAEKIPLIARIVGVADTFDAITTTRPYQTAYSTDYALQTIKKLTGTKFDPKIVTAFLLAWEAGHIRKEAGDKVSKVKVPTLERIAAN